MSLVSRFGKSFAQVKPKLFPMDGNAAAAHVAYAMSEASFLYPITPSTPMGEAYDKWVSQGKTNVFNQVPTVKVLQSEGGAAGALHGAAAVGTFCTTFTASQGLLLMIPNMFKTAGELWPAVFHVAARAVSTQALSIQGDHSDIMSVKNTGFALLSSSTVQECMDLAAIAHMSSLDSQIPFVHFFEGFKLSHQIDSIVPLTMDEMKQLMPYDKLSEVRKRAMNPAHPIVLGHSQGPDAYFQTVELGNPFYQAIPEIVEQNLQTFETLTGRHYSLFDYFGHPEAEDVVVIMGAGAPVVQEAVDLMNARGSKVGLLVPHLYRPWSMKHFMQALPRSAKRVAVLDRSKDPAGPAEPLFMDVAFTLKQMNCPAKVVGGRYGLAAREFTPPMAKAVFDNLQAENPKESFTVGLKDDVTFLSLPDAKLPGFGETDNTQCIMWGLGGDGTIGANKAAIKAAIAKKGMYAQGNFAYSADKSNSLTRSYLRFGKQPIRSQYTIVNADLVGCTLPAYVTQYPLAASLKDNGTFLCNFPITNIEEIGKHWPADLKRTLAKKHAKLYVIDASEIAHQCGLRGKISTIMQACFYHLSNILGEDWLAITDEWIENDFGRLGDEVVKANKKSARMAVENLKELEIPESWLDASDPPERFKSKAEISFDHSPTHEVTAFRSEVLTPTFATAGGSLPVSAFRPCLGGVSPLATTRYLKKGLSLAAPHWDPSTCVQCNLCSAVCPHSVIRPFLLSDSEIESAPEEIKDQIHTLKAKGKELKGLNFRIQVSPYDCVGCELCVNSCPTNSLSMLSTADDEGIARARMQNDMFIYMTDVIPNRGDLVKDKYTLRGSQFQMPHIEFPGSCAGCSETQATKIVTQLFGKRMVIANASGCSSVWGGAYPKIPFTTDSDGRGPCWGRSLFEDNAEYGFGMAIGLESRRQHLHNDVGAILNDRAFCMTLSPSVTHLLWEWYEHWQDGDYTLKIEKPLLEAVKQYTHVQRFKPLLNQRDLWVKPSHWILGGDGWAYDIGYGGLDHVMASGKNFNVLVFDNEVYSNTGGQQSKATQLGAVAQFAALGKDTFKKDLAFMMMNYTNVYVASCALGTAAHMKHFIKCLKEAESFDGPSLIVCNCNCILHHIRGAIGAGGKGGIKAQTLAVESGYWPLYSYDPRREDDGKNPFEIISKAPNLTKLDEFLNMEVRFNGLKRQNPQAADRSRKSLHKFIVRRWKKYENFRRVFEEQNKQ